MRRLVARTAVKTVVRTAVSTATAATLALGALTGAGAATAHAQSTVDSLADSASSVTDGLSSAVTDPQGSSDRAQEELPEYLTRGSSGVEQMSASDTSSQSWFQGSSQVVLDWVIGAVLITAVGQVIQIVASNFL